MILGRSLKVSENRRTMKVEIVKEGMNMKLSIFIRHVQSEWNAPQFIYWLERWELTDKKRRRGPSCWEKCFSLIRHPLDHVCIYQY